MLFVAGASLFELLTAGRDLKPLGFHLESKLVGDFVLEFINLFAFEFHNLFAILADDMIMVGMGPVVRVVELVVLAEVHFAK